jgi:4-amino-4-deoxy-L-arabinose transferase-like glycosyltransferase
MAELAKGLRAYIIIGLLAALSALAGVFTLPPLDRDESRYAQATAQMLESGDFIRINFLDTARNKKPAGIYWMQAAAVSLFSDAEARQIWVYRLPSVFGAILAALACLWGGRKLVGREAAFAGAALFAVTALLGIEGGIAKTDAMLVGTTTLAMAALAKLRAEDGGRKTSIIFWLAMGLGLLIKGPITPMVVGLSVTALVIWERRANWLKPLLFWPGPLLAIAIFVPWLVAIQMATDGGFLREALGDDLGPKLVGGHERHGGLPGYYLSFIPILLFPATLFLVPGIGRLWTTLRLKIDNRAADAARFLICWVVPTWLLFELTPTKLPHYVLPTYPALALIAGWGLMEIRSAAPWQRWTSWGIFAVGALVSAIVFPAIAIIGSNAASWDAVRLSMAGFQGGFELGMDEATIAIVMTGAVLFALVAGAALLAERRAGVLALVLAVAAGLSWQVMGRTTSLPNAYAARLADQVRGAREYSQTIAGISPDEIVTASSFTEPSLVFSLGSDTVLGTAEEVLAFAESREESTMVVLDLSRDVDLARDLILMGESRAELASRIMETAYSPVEFASPAPIEPEWAVEDRERLERLAWMERLDICYKGLASGTNYSRGDETTLAILFTRCAPEPDQ